MAGGDTPGRFHAAPTGNRKEPVWKQAPFSSRQPVIGPPKKDGPPTSADPFRRK